MTAITNANSNATTVSSSIPLISCPPLIPFPTDTDMVWRKYLKDTTQKREGVDPQEAQIICLGDVHTENWQTQWRGALLDRYGSNGDYLLCEGYPSYKAFAQGREKERFEAQTRFSCYGCDDSTLVKQHLDVAQAAIKLIEKYDEEEPSSKWSKEDKEAWKSNVLEDDTLCWLRTQRMIKTTKVFLKRLKPGQKIFIVSGSDHFLAKLATKTGTVNHNIIDTFNNAKVSMLLPRVFSDNYSEETFNYIKDLSQK